MLWKSDTRLKQELARMTALAEKLGEEVTDTKADRDLLQAAQNDAVEALKRAREHINHEAYNDALSSVNEALCALGEPLSEEEIS